MIYLFISLVKSASILLWSLVHAIHDQMAWADFTLHFLSGSGCLVELLKRKVKYPFRIYHGLFCQDASISVRLPNRGPAC